MNKGLNYFWKYLHRPQGTILSAAVLIMFSYGLSMVLGVVRQRLMVTYFFSCCKLEYDAYLAAFRLPDTLFQLMVAGTISAAFIPIFSQLIDKSRATAQRVAATVFNGLMVSFWTLGIPLIIWAPQFSQLITGSFNQHQVELMAQLMRLLLVAQGFLLVSSFLTGVLQSYQRFLLAALAPVIYNLGIILGIVTLAPRWGIYGPVIGVMVGAFFHALLQWPLAWKLGWRYQWRWDFNLPAVREMIKLAIPRSLAASVSQFEATAAVFLATSLTSGSLVIFDLAQTLMLLPIRLVSVPVSQAALPSLAKAAAKDKYAYGQLIVENLLQITYLVLPVTAMVLILRIPIVRLAYGAANFPWKATLLTGRTLALFVLAIPCQAWAQLLIRGFYAQKDAKVPLISGLLSIVMFLSLGWWLTFQWSWGVMGLALATSVASFSQLLLLVIWLNKKVKILTQSLVVPLVKLLAATLLMAVGIWIPMRLLDQLVFDTTRVLPLIGLTITVASIGLAVYFLLGYWLKVEQQVKILRLLENLPGTKRTVAKLRTLTAMVAETPGGG